MVAVQGPTAREKVIGLLREADRARVGKLGKFVAGEAQHGDGMPLFVARTGYTGEDGFEIVVPRGRRPSRSGTRCSAPASSRPAWARATRCAWRPA